MHQTLQLSTSAVKSRLFRARRQLAEEYKASVPAALERSPMEHQPFENWILSGDPLTPSQITESERSSGDLPALPDRSKKVLSGVKMLFKSATFESPSPGFTHRFQVMAAQREEEARRLQSYFFLGWTMIVTVLVSIGYFTTLMLTKSPTEVISDLMTSTINVAFQFDTMIAPGENLVPGHSVAYHSGDCRRIGQSGCATDQRMDHFCVESLHTRSKSK